MASNSMVLMLLFLTLSVLAVTSFEFQVGDTNDWDVHPPMTQKFTMTGPPRTDTVRKSSPTCSLIGEVKYFKYKKDSVMEVTEAEYKKCNSTHPNFFSNSGDTFFKLDWSEPFYFISRSSGHYSREQRMIVKVMFDEDSQSGSCSSSSGSAVVAILLCGVVVAPLAFSNMF